MIETRPRRVTPQAASRARTAATGLDDPPARRSERRGADQQHAHKARRAARTQRAPRVLAHRETRHGNQHVVRLRLGFDDARRTLHSFMFSCRLSERSGRRG
eukprot:7379343-Prymnesium_polylepis.2